MAGGKFGVVTAMAELYGGAGFWIDYRENGASGFCNLTLCAFFSHLTATKRSSFDATNFLSLYIYVPRFCILVAHNDAPPEIAIFL